MAKAEQPNYSAEHVLDAFIAYLNGSVVEVEGDIAQHNEFKQRNPDSADDPTVTYKEGELLGRRRELTGVRAVIERVQAELSDTPPFPGMTNRPAALDQIPELER